MNYPENRKKYNGIEYTDELDLDIYDAQLRNLDPQIGRWNQIDPKTESMEMWSPYASNYDNPVRFNDFLGDEPDGGPGLGFIPFIIPAGLAAGDAIIAGGAAAGATAVILTVINAVKSADLSGIGSGGSITMIPDQLLHPSAVTETKPGVALPTPKEMPVPVNGRLDAPTDATVKPANYVMVRGRNWIPDKATPNTTVTNKPGTTTKVYGPDGWVQKEYNKAHQGRTFQKLNNQIMYMIINLTLIILMKT